MMRRMGMILVLMVALLGGVSADESVACATCSGSGVCQVCDGSGTSSNGEACYICDGSEDCAVCDGTKKF